MRAQGRRAVKLVFLNLGRRGGGVQLAHGLLAAALSMPGIEPYAIISASAENVGDFRVLAADRLLELQTFRPFGPLGLLTNYPAARQRIRNYLAEIGADAVFCVMPHVWTPLLCRTISGSGVSYATLIHDAVPHPGDLKGLVTNWLRSEATMADLVVTMSTTVADQLQRDKTTPSQKLLTLFHPDYSRGSGSTVRVRLDADAPLRLLFFGRMIPYKGIDLLANTLVELRRRRVPIELTIAGEGELGPSREVFSRHGATIINRWQTDAEVGKLFACHDAAITSHVEASQSGIPALAFAHGMPVVSTPVGGLREQVGHERTGLLARSTTPSALADEVARLQADPALYSRMSSTIAEQAKARSPERFVVALVERLAAGSS